MPGARRATMKQKVVVIIGSTGAGKSKLGIEVAQAFKGNVINADVMQMYNGLEIGTAKVTPEECEGVKHHLLSFLEPTDQYTPAEFRDAAMAVIAQLSDAGTLPILVGGTFYYLQSLLWTNSLLDDLDAIGEVQTHPTNSNHSFEEEVAETTAQPNSSFTKQEMYDRLIAVDPIMAAKLHPKDSRRIRRALEIFDTTGVAQSTWLQRQKEESRTALSRYDACIIWVDTNLASLDERLDKRVDKMLTAGLMKEVTELWKRVSKKSEDSETPEQVGVLQSIGYKEFEPCLKWMTEHPTEEIEKSESGLKVLQHCAEKLKRNTKVYARKQLRWIRSRIVTKDIPVYKVDSSDPSQWEISVKSPAIEIVSSFLKGDTGGIKHTPCNMTNEPDFSQDLINWKKQYCETCDRTLNGEHEWQVHLKSRQHRLKLSKRKRGSHTDHSQRNKTE